MRYHAPAFARAQLDARFGGQARLPHPTDPTDLTYPTYPTYPTYLTQR